VSHADRMSKKRVTDARSGGFLAGPSAGWGVPWVRDRALCRRGASAAPLLHHPRARSNAARGLVFLYQETRSMHTADAILACPRVQPSSEGVRAFAVLCFYAVINYSRKNHTGFPENIGLVPVRGAEAATPRSLLISLS